QEALAAPHRRPALRHRRQRRCHLLGGQNRTGRLERTHRRQLLCRSDAADGRIYFFSEEGKTTVIAADREFKKLAENQLGDGFMASPAVSGKALFLRSRTNLYRVEE